MEEKEASVKQKAKKLTLKTVIELQFIVVIYTLAGVFGKCASEYEFLSFGFIACYGLEVFVLGVYAILWQQIIKKLDLSVAYANRSIAILWSLTWAAIFFGEKITLINMLGVLIVIVGTMLVNGDENG